MRGPSWKVKVLALGISASFGVLLVELALQIHNPIPLPVRGQNHHLSKNARRESKPPFDSPKFDNPIVVHTNSLGFRGPDLPSDPEAWTKVVAIGGSTTECRNTSDGKTWSDHVLGRLRERAPNVWLNNAGLDGNSTFGHARLLDEVVFDLDPDVIVFLIGINDVGLEMQNHDDTATARALNQRLIEASELLSTAQVFWRSFRARSMGNAHFPPLDLKNDARLVLTDAGIAARLDVHRSRFLPGYESRVRHLVESTKKRGITPVLITQPVLYGDARDPATEVDLGTIKVDGEMSAFPEGDNGKSRHLTLELYNDVVRKVGAELGVLVIDLAQQMPKDSSLYMDWMHFTNEGNEKVAQIVGDALIPALAPR